MSSTDDEDDDGAFAATDEIVKARLRQLGCVFVGMSLTATLYRTPEGRHFYVPQPLIGGVGYTVRQINLLELKLAVFGIDLLPFDYHLN